MAHIYYMSVPFAGTVLMTVVADSPEEAREKALTAELRFTVTEELVRGDYESRHVELQQVDLYEDLVQGNVLCVEQNSISIDEVEGLEED